MWNTKGHYRKKENSDAPFSFWFSVFFLIINPYSIHYMAFHLQFSKVYVILFFLYTPKMHRNFSLKRANLQKSHHCTRANVHNTLPHARQYYYSLFVYLFIILHSPLHSFNLLRLVPYLLDSFLFICSSRRLKDDAGKQVRQS